MPANLPVRADGLANPYGIGASPKANASSIDPALRIKSLPADELERLLNYVVEYGGELGKTDGTTVGSVHEARKAFAQGNVLPANILTASGAAHAIASSISLVKSTYAAAGQTLTLDASTLPNDHWIRVIKANTGAFSISLFGGPGDTINGGTAGASFVLPGSGLATSTTEGERDWWIYHPSGTTLYVYGGNVRLDTSGNVDLGAGTATAAKLLASSGLAGTTELLSLTSTAGTIKQFVYVGTPEGAVTAGPGSWCFDPINGTAYRKITGTGNTGWREVSPSVSGTWTPIGTALTNLDSITPGVSRYFQVFSGATSRVFFSTSGTMDPTASAPVNFGITIPIPSNFTATNDAHGVASSQLPAAGFAEADATNDRLNVWITSSGSASTRYWVSGSYEVL